MAAPSPNFDMPHPNEQRFLKNLLPSFLTHIKRAQQKALESRGTKHEAFDLGVLQSYWQVLTSIISRMDVHELDRHEYGFDGYDPDTRWSPIQQALKDAKSSSQDVTPQ